MMAPGDAIRQETKVCDLVQLRADRRENLTSNTADVDGTSVTPNI